MKCLMIAALALPITFALAFGQGIHIGPGGVGIDVGGREGVRGGDGDRVVREYQDDDGCIVRVIRHRSPDGDIVMDRTRDCD